MVLFNDNRPTSFFVIIMFQDSPGFYLTGFLTQQESRQV